ncbi:MAG: penicillin-binding protein 2 [Phenylobacterium sp.]|uniref:penicillin-binding protein 2 n=1 Tax=Phenylobacterium sp. TaxID=1871053 RepID=UPI0025D1FFB5|nr:penicillin-binding protein 2 [Phenylobacterium sp.]MCA6233680.1 penicillin-binding protein 2 [Phenylobacterium sp.]MCA6248023.1 penicillin-binding protein 2 [Phenylobacterium sp.]
MTQPSIILSDVNARQSVFHRRAFLLGGGIAAGIAALGGRLGYLQLVENARYAKLSTSNQFNFRLVPPPRGLITDRNGAILATNRPNFRLLYARQKDQDPETVISTLAAYVPMDEARQQRILKDLGNAPRNTPVAIMEDITWEQFSAVSIRGTELPGVTADMGEVRVYPHGGAFAHVIGYVAKVNKEDITETGPNAESIMLHPGFRIGRQGLEKALDLELRGRPGAQKVEVDARGRQVRLAPGGDVPATPGKEVQLSLDMDLQLRGLELFGEESGAAVLMDCRSGDILAMVSAPSFDANRFVRGLSAAEYKALAEYDHKPLFNKALTATYPPGSTFKTLVAVAALEAGFSADMTINCPGHWNFGGRRWRCDAVHGATNMHDAIATSCDTYFYTISLKLGPDRIADTARRFGLGQAFDIGIPGQKKGLIPDTAYKRRAFPRDPVWHPGETPSFGIGQGYTLVTALQQCVAAARMANGRKALVPRLIRSVGGVATPDASAAPDLDFDPAHLALVREAMGSVTTRGTAARTGQIGLGDVRMSGKTGTAQGYNYNGGRGVHGTAGPWHLRDHAWFTGFAPHDTPRYAIAVLVEHGGFGAQAAAPRARDLMRLALLKDPELRSRIERPPAPPVAVADSRGPVEGGPA